MSPRNQGGGLECPGPGLGVQQTHWMETNIHRIYILHFHSTFVFVSLNTAVMSETGIWLLIQDQDFQNCYPFFDTGMETF